MGWQDILTEAAKTDRWEQHIRGRLGEVAEALIHEAHMKAIYQGGRISDRLAEVYADAIETGVYADVIEREGLNPPPPGNSTAFGWNRG